MAAGRNIEKYISYNLGYFSNQYMFPGVSLAEEFIDAIVFMIWPRSDPKSKMAAIRRGQNRRSYD